jgi:hypothetical protein
MSMTIKNTRSITHAVSETVQRLVATRRFFAEEAIEAIKENFPKEYAAYEEALADIGLLKMVKEQARALSEPAGTAPAQSQLPGFDPPGAITVPHNGKFEYVPWRLSTWADLLAHRDICRKNATLVNNRLVDIELKIEALRPVMENAPALLEHQAEALLYP